MMKNFIQRYQFGQMMINNQDYTEDLIIFGSEKIIASWWREQGHSLAITDLKEIFDFQPQLLIVGLGYSSCMQIPELTKAYLEEKGIELITADTSKAKELFNKYLAPKVVGAFHLTC